MTVVDVIAALAPHVLWMLFLGFVLWFVGGNTLRDLLSRVNSVEFGGVRIGIESAVQSAAAQRHVRVSPETTREVAQRLRRAQPLFAATRFLWIDDNPTWNTAEMRILKGLGATIDFARSNAEARERLSGAVYDIVLSDIDRGERGDEGIRFLPEALGGMLDPTVIFYVAESKGTPEGAFGIATRPDELLHLIVDALERQPS